MDIKEQQSKKAYDKIAQDYNDTFDGRFTRSFKDELVSNVTLKPDDTVVDVACGIGELLARFDAKCNIQGFGIDISDEMIRMAKSKYPKFNFIVASCAPLPFADNTFDVLTVSAAFHHFPEPKKFAGEAFRVLKPSGGLYIAEVYFPILIRQITNALILPLYNAGDVKVYHPKELMEIFKEAGFSDLSIVRKGKVQLLKAVK